MREQDLVEQCKQGSHDAYRILYERYAGRLLAVCIRYVSSREIAEDLLHDGFIKIFDSFEKFT